MSDLEAGPELDALITEKVMAGIARPYSTDLAAAMEVVVKLDMILFPLRAYRDYDDWNQGRTDGDETWWLAAQPRDHFNFSNGFALEDTDPYLSLEGGWGRENIAPTAPLAICRAALKPAYQDELAPKHVP